MSTRTTSTRQRPRSRGRASTRRRGQQRRGARSKVRRSHHGRIRAALIAMIAVLSVTGAIAVGALIAHALTSPLNERSDDAPFVEPPAPTAPAVAGYGVDQLAHACAIMSAGRDLGLDTRDQTIAVMTAMGESSLRNLDYGDWETSGVTNPDGSRTTSIGLFQQQDGWGSREARLDPYTAANIFYRAMIARVPDRAALEPTVVAHRTQINADRSTTPGTGIELCGWSPRSAPLRSRVTVSTASLPARPPRRLPAQAAVGRLPAGVWISQNPNARISLAWGDDFANRSPRPHGSEPRNRHLGLRAHSRAGESVSDVLE